MILEIVPVGGMQVNCYILASAKNSQAIIIDPGDQERKIRQVLTKHNLAPAFVINTHGHYDHIGDDDKFGVDIYVHKADKIMLEDPMANLSGLFASPYSVKSQIKIMEDEQVVGLDDIKLKVLHVPGHTPGGIALEVLAPVKNIVFTGDTLFSEGIGRSDLIGGDSDLLVKSIREKLFVLPDETKIYPGHGPASTIGAEKKNGMI